MEELNTLTDVEVGSEALQETEAEATSEVTEEVTTEPVVEPAKPQQTAEENARFAAARREAEAEARAIRAQNDRLLQALNAYGYEGSPEEIADTLLAQTQNISVEEARAVREADEANNAKLAQMQAENEFYRTKAIQAAMAEDLAKLKSTYPEDKTIQNLKDINDLGQEYFALLGALNDPTLAYDALQIKKNRETKPIPKDIGATNASSGKEKDFYTPDEVDKLTEADYEKNPKLWGVVRKSMLKW